MAKISEETTKGLVAEKLKNISGYPSAQNTKVDGITCFKRIVTKEQLMIA